MSAAAAQDFRLEVDNAGTVFFREKGDATEVEIELSYDPPGGRVGHRIAQLFGADPASRMDEDLARLRRFIEAG